MLPRRYFRLAVAAALGLAPASLVQAQAPSDLLDRQRRLNQIAAQQITQEVEKALGQAQQLARTDPAGAIRELQRVAALVEADSALTPAHKDELGRRIRDRIRTLVNTAALPPQPPRFVRPTEEHREASEVRKAIREIARHQEAGAHDQAAREAADLVRRYPDNPAAQIMKRSSGMADRVAQAQELLDEADRRILAALRDVDRSAMPANGDVEFPKDWAEKTKRRQSAINPLSDKEKALLRSLETPVTVNWQNVPFEEAIQVLSDQTGQTILLDKTALQEAGVTSDTVVSLRAPGKLTVRTVLRKILQDVGLNYTIKGESLHVTTQERIRETLSTRVYPIGDLVVGVGDFGGGAVFGPFLDQLQTNQNATNIVEMIQKKVEPWSWRSGGGPGTIIYDPVNKALVIRQTAEVHAMLRGGFTR